MKSDRQAQGETVSGGQWTSVTSKEGTVQRYKSYIFNHGKYTDADAQKNNNGKTGSLWVQMGFINTVQRLHTTQIKVFGCH